MSYVEVDFRHYINKLRSGENELITKEVLTYVVEPKEPYQVQERVIVSGDIIEYYHYQKPIVKNFQSKVASEGKKSMNDSQEDKQKRVDKVNQSVKTLRRLINANADKSSCFVTLTYKENMQDVDKGKDDFKKFIKRWNYQRKKKGLLPLKYVYVIEFQKRGAVHFHTIFFGLEFTKAEEIKKLWGNGKIDIKLIDKVDNVGSYIMKYMSKEVSDERLKGKDLYGRSKGNLLEPQIIEKKELIKKLLAKNTQNLAYENQFGETDSYRGIVTYKQFNLKRLKEYKKTI